MQNELSAEKKVVQSQQHCNYVDMGKLYIYIIHTRHIVLLHFKKYTLLNGKLNI